MTKVIGVRFKDVGKVYYFDPQDQEIRKGDWVIVETVRGIECGEVAMDPREIEEESVAQPLKPVRSGWLLRRIINGWKRTVKKKNMPLRFVKKRLRPITWK